MPFQRFASETVHLLLVATEDAAALGRLLPDDNASEILSLDDYRKRYALYRTDADLQLLPRVDLTASLTGGTGARVSAFSLA